MVVVSGGMHQKQKERKNGATKKDWEKEEGKKNLNNSPDDGQQPTRTLEAGGEGC